ncbi:ankyrin 2,3/unc44 containing protein [Planoprotostelium fungivorum]|uniref:Ankyrin 2,3/unc44 containing protein n=1 Tax=Planoprotostelium fungivorum TaxID=1890364 RepID=A0A2P6NU09_9EUKA|nr:ankyrin 2,3/unc44 containing protein [Planoprotostelium fungivorum]
MEESAFHGVGPQDLPMQVPEELTYTPEEVISWTPDQVMHWFDSMINSTPALSNHRDRFRKQELHGETLLKLTIEELKAEEFPLGPRKQIMDWIGKINANVGGQNVHYGSVSRTSQDIDVVPPLDEIDQTYLDQMLSLADYNPSLLYDELKYCISTCKYRRRGRAILLQLDLISYRKHGNEEHQFILCHSLSTRARDKLEKNPCSVDHLKILALCAKWTLKYLPRLSSEKFQKKLTPEMKQQRCIVFQETSRRPSYGGVIESQWISDCKKNITACGSMNYLSRNKEGVWIFKNSLHQIIVFGKGHQWYPQNCKGMRLTPRDANNYFLWRAGQYVEIQYKYYWDSGPITYKIIWSHNQDRADLLDCLDNLSKYYPEAVHKLGHVSFIRTREDGSEEMTTHCAEDAVDIHQMESFIVGNRLTMISVCHIVVCNGSDWNHVWLRSDDSPSILRIQLKLDATQEFEFTPLNSKARGKRAKLQFRDPCDNEASSIELPKICFELQKLLEASADKIIQVSVVSRQQGMKQPGPNAGMEHITPGAQVRITATEDYNYDSRKRVREDSPKIEGEKRHKKSGCVKTVRVIRVTEENVQLVREMATYLKRKAEDKNSRVVFCKIEPCSAEEYDAFVEEVRLFLNDIVIDVTKDEKPLDLNENGHNTYIRVYGEEYYRSMSLPTDNITMDTLKSRVKSLFMIESHHDVQLFLEEDKGSEEESSEEEMARVPLEQKSLKELLDRGEYLDIRYHRVEDRYERQLHGDQENQHGTGGLNKLKRESEELTDKLEDQYAPSYFQELSGEIVLNILYHLSPRDIRSVHNTCRHLQEWVCSTERYNIHIKEMWRQLSLHTDSEPSTDQIAQPVLSLERLWSLSDTHEMVYAYLLDYTARCMKDQDWGRNIVLGRATSEMTKREKIDCLIESSWDHYARAAERNIDNITVWATWAESAFFWHDQRTINRCKKKLAQQQRATLQDVMRQIHYNKAVLECSAMYKIDISIYLQQLRDATEAQQARRSEIESRVEDACQWAKSDGLDTQTNQCISLMIFIESGERTSDMAKKAISISLENACINNQLDAVEFLVDIGADIHGINNEGRAPLHNASRYGCTETVEDQVRECMRVNARQLLMEMGANVDHCTSSRDKKQSSLHFASSNGWTEAVQLLLEKKANIRYADSDGRTSLLHASSNGHTEVVKNITTPCKQQWSHQDSEGKDQNGHTETVKLLLQSGADVGHTDGHNMTALHEAYLNDHRDTIEMLIESYTRRHNAHTDCMHHTDQSETKVDIVEILIGSGFDFNYSDISGQSLLHAASKANNMKTIEFLTKMGANVNCTDNNGKTPLHYASNCGHTEAAKLLIDKGSKITYTDIGGKIPLHHASSCGHTKTVKMLIEMGSKISTADIKGKTPLHDASSYGRTETVKLLLHMGADIDCTDEYNSTPLIGASRFGHTEIVKLLLGKKADVAHPDTLSRIALHHASRYGHIDTVELLLKTGGEYLNEEVETVRRLIQKQLLLEMGANIRCIDRSGKMPFHYARDNGHTQTAKMLEICSAEHLASFTSTLASQHQRLTVHNPFLFLFNFPFSLTFVWYNGGSHFSLLIMCRVLNLKEKCVRLLSIIQRQIQDTNKL